MGRKLKERPTDSNILGLLSSMLVPAYILKDFEVSDVLEDVFSWTIELCEKPDNIPASLSVYCDVVFDGYCNSIDLLSQSLTGKPVYLRLYRRRYKRSNSNTHYSNIYDYTLKGIKMTQEMGTFLKE